ncbi:UDP-N-acetylglucosamine 2-epimerase (hydrolyzing) (plasmid) [Pseudohalocynthiibacter aestuariivivens]|uniref:UDP-N-acetylglucosamine 2-epimerase n=1 Tax=Roseovarius pelagicus TaxID=2980108 RepID=A0ABY6D5F8_9RHOB|nr:MULTISPECIES: UDP-N-acetylglucosamine 2-epimerase [Rhodobacterales]QIE47910.1 UDP-N-acetylglucosamine 2-epimerase (hydrolyzing) [Pseudohalocynthiibacter aestuariivivens]UXX81404.1 UDP-N-acetylglucosamine 2-epimerase [Roseovarius pelagicus]
MKIHYVTGSRADFGLMEKTLQLLHQTEGFEVGIIATGQHLVARYGQTLSDIEASGLPVVHEIPVSLSGVSGAEMAQALSTELSGLVSFWQQNRPDIALVLGDRGEMLAAALAAVHLGIFVGHLHGGEVSGTLDESFRHAISKLCHFHFPATDESQDRLVRMGEHPDHIWTVGAPGLVGLTQDRHHVPGWFDDRFGLAPAAHRMMMVFHPVVQEADQAAAQVATVIAALTEQDCGGIILRPNSDAGGAAIDMVLDQLPDDGRFTVRDHLERDTYLECMANLDLLIGNSSSGIIETASFNLPCLNIGSRQNGRQRNANVVDCPDITAQSVSDALQQALTLGRGPYVNLYGDGHTATRLRDILKGLTLNPATLSKTNAY